MITRQDCFSLISDLHVKICEIRRVVIVFIFYSGTNHEISQALMRFMSRTRRPSSSELVGSPGRRLSQFRAAPPVSPLE